MRRLLAAGLLAAALSPATLPAPRPPGLRTAGAGGRLRPQEGHPGPGAHLHHHGIGAGHRPVRGAGLLPPPDPAAGPGHGRRLGREPGQDRLPLPAARGGHVQQRRPGPRPGLPRRLDAGHRPGHQGRVLLPVRRDQGRPGLAQRAEGGSGHPRRVRQAPGSGAGEAGRAFPEAALPHGLRSAAPFLPEPDRLGRFDRA